MKRVVRGGSIYTVGKTSIVKLYSAIFEPFLIVIFDIFPFYISTLLFNHIKLFDLILT